MGTKETQAPKRAGPADVTRSLPEALAAEAAVLGSMMVDPNCIGDIDLVETDFYHREHQIIFKTVRELYEKNDAKGVDGLLVRRHLEAHNRLAEIGNGNEVAGMEYLQKILETVPSSANAAYYAGIVKEAALRRAYIAVGQDISEAAYDQSQDIEEVANVTEGKLTP